MSQENLEIVRRIFETGAVGDFTAGASSFDPDGMLVIRHPFPDAQVVVGADGVREYMRDLMQYVQRRDGP
jgi:ketosteroid isomerase-like protein